MKNLLLSVFLFLSVMPLWSQQLTKKDLQGKWKLVKYETTDVTLDLISGTAKVNDVTTKKIGPELSDRLKKDTEILTDVLRSDYLEIEGAKFSLLSDNVVKLGTYKITRDKKNNPVAIATFKDTSKSTVPLIMKDGKIVLKQKYTGKIYTYEKQI